MENNSKNKFKYHTVLFEYLIDSVINTLLYYLCVSILYSIENGYKCGGML